MRFPVHSPCPLLGGTAGTVGGIARTLSHEGELQGLFCMRGNGKDSFACGGTARASLQGNCGGSLGVAGGAWTS